MEILVDLGPNQSKSTEFEFEFVNSQFHAWVYSALHVESPVATTGGRRCIRKTVILRRGLPYVHTRDGARDDEALNFRSPLKDGAYFQKRRGPLTGLFDSFGGDSGRFGTRYVGLERA